MRRRTDSPPPRPVTGVLTTSGREHWRRRTARQLARPSSGAGGVTFLVLVLVVGAIVALALAVPGAHIDLP